MSEHIPVLVQEVLALLNPKPGEILLDATLGQGGYAEHFLSVNKKCIVIGVDRDSAQRDVAASLSQISTLFGIIPHLSTTEPNCVVQRLQEPPASVCFNVYPFVTALTS